MNASVNMFSISENKRQRKIVFFTVAIYKKVM